MIELLIAILKMLVVLIVCSIGYTIVFAWDVPDKRGGEDGRTANGWDIFYVCIMYLYFWNNKVPDMIALGV